MTRSRLRRVMIDTGQGFIADECLSRAASIAYFTLFSLSPLLVIAMAIAGAAFGEEAVRGAVQDQLRGLLGREAAASIEAAISGARDVGRGVFAGALGIGMLVLTASGTFGEIQSALNVIWKTTVPPQGTVSRLLRAKAAAIGLVAGTGFLLLASLLASAAIAAFGTTLKGLLPGSAALLEALNAAVSLALTAALFGAIYKILPDRRIAWRDVAVGALATAILFTLGKSAIGLYVGGAGIAGSFGAAGSLAAVLVWIYYSAVIFLLGAEFTRAWASHEGSRQAVPVPPEMAPPLPPVAATPARPSIAASTAHPSIAATPAQPPFAPTPARPPAPFGAIAATLAAVVGVILLRRPRQRG